MSRLSDHLKLPFPLGEQPLPTDDRTTFDLEFIETGAEADPNQSTAAVDPAETTADTDDATSSASPGSSDSDADVDPAPATTATID